MKNLKKFSFLFLLVAMTALTITSCKDKDTCYECTGYDDGTTSLEDLGTICEGDDDGSGGTISKSELEATVTLYESFGGTCSKK